jgi:HD-GYP domain-containing protein (c-di-GMP phosphodiesterase class II)
MSLIDTTSVLDFDVIFDKINLDKKTKLHCLRVGRLSHLLAVYCNLSDEDINLSHLCGRYHDIGKAAPEIQDILNIPRRFNSDEKKIMKLHVNIGCDFLDIYGNLFNFDIDFTKFKYGVLNHHENFDGSGYFGLSGGKIPVWSRVVVICDYLDALMEKRSYKDSFSFDKSIMVMKDNSHFFDPNIFDIFLNNLEKIEKFHKKLKF